MLGEDAQSRRSLRWLMSTYSSQICSDARDQIYALLSLASDCDGFEADYTISCAALFWKTLVQDRKGFDVYSIGVLRSALSMTVSAVRTSQDVESFTESICSINVKQWATLVNVLFTKIFYQHLAGNLPELQYHSFAILSTDDIESQSLLVFIISRAPLSLQDIVARVLVNAPFYVILRKQASKFITLGRAYPIGHSSDTSLEDSELMANAHKMTCGIPSTPVEVGTATETESLDHGNPASSRTPVDEKFNVRVTRSIILEICEQQEWEDCQEDTSSEEAISEDMTPEDTAEDKL